MATYYTFVEESNGKRNLTSMCSTRKRDIESKFNRLVNGLEKTEKYVIEYVREGYVRYTYFGDYCTFEGEYYIVRN